MSFGTEGNSGFGSIQRKTSCWENTRTECSGWIQGIYQYSNMKMWFKDKGLGHSLALILFFFLLYHIIFYPAFSLAKPELACRFFELLVKVLRPLSLPVGLISAAPCIGWSPEKIGCLSDMSETMFTPHAIAPLNQRRKPIFQTSIPLPAPGQKKTEMKTC